MDSRWFWIGIAAIGALFLLPEKKRARKPKGGKVFMGFGEAVDRYKKGDRVMLMSRYGNVPLNTEGTITKIWSEPESDMQWGRVLLEDNITGKRRERNYPLSVFYNLSTSKMFQDQPKPDPRQMILLGGLSAISLDVKKRCVPDITRKKIRCRVQEPKEFDGFFTRASTAPGVSYVMGLVDGKGITQSVMFDKKIWDTKMAKTWFNRNINRLLARDKKALNLQG